MVTAGFCGSGTDGNMDCATGGTAADRRWTAVCAVRTDRRVDAGAIVRSAGDLKERSAESFAGARLLRLRCAGAPTAGGVSGDVALGTGKSGAATGRSGRPSWRMADEACGAPWTASGGMEGAAARDGAARTGPEAGCESWRWTAGLCGCFSGGLGMKSGCDCHAAGGSILSGVCGRVGAAGSVSASEGIRDGTWGDTTVSSATGSETGGSARTIAGACVCSGTATGGLVCAIGRVIASAVGTGAASESIAGAAVEARGRCGTLAGAEAATLAGKTTSRPAARGMDLSAAGRPSRGLASGLGGVATGVCSCGRAGSGKPAVANDSRRLVKGAAGRTVCGDEGFPCGSRSARRKAGSAKAITGRGNAGRSPNSLRSFARL